MMPLIGITSSKTMPVPPYEGSYVNDGYFAGIARFGGIPVILPIVEQEEVWLEAVNRVDAIIFTGGVDIHPHFYREEPNQKIGEIMPLRDQMEIKMAQYAMELNKPILGICRGIQLLNVAQGGTLYQDIPSQVENAILHSQTAPRYEATHYIAIAKDSILYDIVQSEKIRTNSFHHQAIKGLASGFRKIAEASDGIIEAIESIDHDFVLGLQFHPEMMWHRDRTMASIGEYFVNYVKKLK